MASLVLYTLQPWARVMMIYVWTALVHCHYGMSISIVDEEILVSVGTPLPIHTSTWCDCNHYFSFAPATVCLHIFRNLETMHD